MNTRLLLLAVIAAAFGACERQPSAEDRRRAEQKAEEEARIAELRALEERAEAREASERSAELDRERDELAAERSRLESDRESLQEEQRRATDARLAQIREAERVNELREEERRAEQRRINQRLAEERAEAARAAEEQARAEQTMDFFYDALEPQGDWVHVERYGYCWQPRAAANPAWRPYVDGHWAYTNYGWTWVSNEPFGWATYHYGRWTRARRLGWIWVPGSEWAPAWVSWRRSSSHVGWAPLPPEAYSRGGFTAAVERNYDIGPAHYNFVRMESFGEPTYAGRILDPEQNITVVKQTVNVTNITYRKVENRTIIYNEGPDVAELDRHAKVRRLSVERVPQASTAVEASGNTLRLMAPFIAPSSKTNREPARVRERVKAPEMERGWTGLAAAATAELRQQQKQEAAKAEQTPRPAAGSTTEPRPAAAKPEPAKAEAKPAPTTTPATGRPGAQPTASPSTATKPPGSASTEARPERPARPVKPPTASPQPSETPEVTPSPVPATKPAASAPPTIPTTRAAPAPATNPPAAEKLPESKPRETRERDEKPGAGRNGDRAEPGAVPASADSEARKGGAARPTQELPSSEPKLAPAAATPKPAESAVPARPFKAAPTAPIDAPAKRGSTPQPMPSDVPPQTAAAPSEKPPTAPAARKNEEGNPGAKTPRAPGLNRVRPPDAPGQATPPSVAPTPPSAAAETGKVPGPPEKAGLRRPNPRITTPQAPATPSTLPNPPSADPNPAPAEQNAAPEEADAPGKTKAPGKPKGTPAGKKTGERKAEGASGGE